MARFGASAVGVRGARAWVAFRLEYGRRLKLGRGNPQFGHLDYGWSSIVRAFQGRVTDNLITDMEARHPHLTTQKSLHIGISRDRHFAELVTDDAAEPKDRLQVVTGERIAALEGIGETTREAQDRGRESGMDTGRSTDGESGETVSPKQEPTGPSAPGPSGQDTK